MDTSYVQVNGIRIAQTVLENDGPPVVLLHGWGANIDLMLPLAQRLNGYRAYVPDLPGFGKSDTPRTSWTVFDYANFVIAYMDDQKIDRACLIGHSHGGRLGLILGAEHPERLIKIALIDSAGVLTPPSTQSSLRLKTYRVVLNALSKTGLKSQADQLRTWYGNRYGSADYKAARGVMRETLVKVVNQDLLPYAARVQPPTLLFWGDKDEDTPLWQGQLLEKTIPDAGLVVWEGAGHYSYLDRLADTARVINHFFKET